ncbi:MAG: LuxR C-terminal-related transcriptional regulator [Parvibaculum sp.]|uniref:helix-turn-helix transcriptional regulator n=1 Tax=Parvibaculum sp. TaxID=2024848 RepID=UPI003C7450A1
MLATRRANPQNCAIGVCVSEGRMATDGNLKGSLPLGLVAQWSKCLAECLTTPDAHSSVEKLATGLRNFVPDTSVYVGFYRRKAPPVVIDFEGSDEWNMGYLEGKYLLDPSYEQFLKRDASVCLSPREMFPPDFRKSDYYISFYRPYGMVDEICYLLYLSNDLAAYVSLMRLADTTPFSNVEFRYLNAVTDSIETVAKRIWSLYDREGGLDDIPSPQLHRVLSSAYERFGDDALSEREKEVTRLLLKGLPPKSVSRMLNIAPGTVRNHIKRIYVKLDVRSQAELLALFFETLNGAAMAQANG